MKKTFIFLLLVLPFSLIATIIETPYFDEIKKYLKPETLVVLDIDDTLLIPTQTLGTDVWFLHRVKEHQQEGMTSADAFEKALAEWQAIRHITKVQIVEPGTDEIIKEMQEKGIVVMGLTTQGLSLATRTLQHLRSLNIDLSKTAPCDEDYYFMNRLGVLYRQGVLFTAGTPKGEALMKLLAKVDHHPKQIIFINDNKKHLLDVEGVAMKHAIEFVGLRYSYCDKRIESFDPMIGDYEWKHSTLNHILSDEEARSALTIR